MEISLSRKFNEVIFIFFLQCSLCTLSIAQSEFDSLLSEFQTVKSSKQIQLLDKIFISITKMDSSIGRERTERLLRITNKFGSRNFYNNVLLFYSRFGAFTERKKIVYGLYSTASEDRDELLMARSLFVLSEIFHQEFRYDSSVHYLFKARDLFKKINLEFETVPLLHMLGDLYFHARLFDNAEKYYKEAIRIKGNLSDWYSWRYYVILNNMAFIHKHRNSFDSSIAWFNFSINELLSNQESGVYIIDTTRIIYAYIQLADLYILKKDYKTALYYYYKGISANLSVGSVDMMTNLYILKGKIFYNEGLYDSSLTYLRKAERLNSQNIPLNIARILYDFYSQVYTAKGDYKNALMTYKKYSLLVDSTNKQQNIFAGIQLITDDYFESAESKIKTYEIRQSILLSIITIVILSVILILIIHLKLKNAYKLLINKNIELMHSENKTFKLKSFIKNQAKEFSAESIPYNFEEFHLDRYIQDEEIPDSAQMSAIVAHLEEVIQKKQLFLDPNLSLDGLAKVLNTNRNYLSKVINQFYGVHFNTYINNLRIKKALLMLSQKHEVDIYNLAGIANTVGFSNRTTFISAFKKYTGVTPSFFLKNLNRQT